MPCLKNLRITSTGDVGHHPTQLRKWVEANGGRWLPSVIKSLTHLICSKDAWKRGNEAVTAAQDLDHVFIVSYDWLEDSLIKKKKLSEKKYLWEKVAKETRKRKKMRRVADLCDRKKFDKGCGHAVEDVGSGASTSSSSKSSAPPSFFRSSLAELKERREARAKAEAEARKTHEAKLLAGSAMKEGHDHVDSTQGIEGNSECRELQMTDVDETHPPADEKKTEEAKDKTGMAVEMGEVEGNALKQDVLGHVERERNFSSASASASPSMSPSTSSPPPIRSTNTSPSPSFSSTTPASTASAQISPILAPTTQAPSPSPPRTERLTDNYHIYLDNTGFEYKINLFRINMPRNALAKYNLRLFESNTKPHVYCTFAQYMPAPEKAPPGPEVVKTASGVPVLIGGWKEEQGKGKGKGKAKPNGVKTDTGSKNTNNEPPASSPPTTSHSHLAPSPPYRALIAPLNSDFATAFAAFTSSFYELTFLPWELRLHAQARTIQKTNARTTRLEPFMYKKPNPGLPPGLVPAVPIQIPKFDLQESKKFGFPGMDIKISGEYSLGYEIIREENARLEALREEAEKKEKERYEKVKREKEVKAKVRRERGGNGVFRGGRFADEYL